MYKYITVLLPALALLNRTQKRKNIDSQIASVTTGKQFNNRLLDLR